MVDPACGENCLELVGNTAASAVQELCQLCCCHYLAACSLQDAVMLLALGLWSWGMLGASCLTNTLLTLCVCPNGAAVWTLPGAELSAVPSINIYS